MCVIVDTNTFGPVFDKKNDKHKDFKPVLDWVLHGKGKFIIGGSKYVGELKKAKRYLKLFQLLATHKVGCSKFESKIRYKKWCYFGAAKLLIFNTLIYEIVL